MNSDLHSNNCYFFEGDKCIADDLFMSCNSLIEEFELLHKDDVIVDAPFISQVLEWLRKDKNIHIEIRLFNIAYGFDVMQIEPKKKLGWSGTVEFESYKEAAIKGIEYTINNF